MHVALAVLHANDLLADMCAESPLHVAVDSSVEGASGLQSPFAQGSYEASMSKNSEYTAGINIFWHDWNYTATPGIPLRSNAVDALLEHYFQTPARFPGMLYISAPSPTYAPLEHKGALQSVSPEEIRAAFLFAFARDVAAGAPENVFAGVDKVFPVLHGSVRGGRDSPAQILPGMSLARKRGGGQQGHDPRNPTEIL